MAKPKYRLRREYLGKIIATPYGRIDGDFFHANENANELIEGNPAVAKFFQTMSGDPIAAVQAVAIEEEASEEGNTEEPKVKVSKDLSAVEAVQAIESLEGEELEAFIEGESRVTVLQAAGEKLG